MRTDRKISPALRAKIGDMDYEEFFKGIHALLIQNIGTENIISILKTPCQVVGVTLVEPIEESKTVLNFLIKPVPPSICTFEEILDDGTILSFIPNEGGDAECIH
jgi:hypothetical protein